MRSGTGCIIGAILAVFFSIVALIAIIILINAIKSIDYQQAADNLREGIQEFNSTLKSVNPTSPSTTCIQIPLH